MAYTLCTRPGCGHRVEAHANFGAGQCSATVCEYDDVWTEGEGERTPVGRVDIAYTWPCQCKSFTTEKGMT